MGRDIIYESNGVDEELEESQNYSSTEELETSQEEQDSVSDEVNELYDSLGVPQKFRGKDINETLSKVTKSYQEIEKFSGRQAQEIGQLRKYTDEYIQRELSGRSDSKGNNEKKKDFSYDDFIENPEEAIKSVVSDDVTRAQEEIARLKLERAQERFNSKHPDWQEEVQDPGFAEWVRNSAYRQRLAQQADQYDFEAADELFSAWKEMKELRRDQAQQAEQSKRDAELRNASVEKGGKAATGKKIFKRSELIRMRIENPDEFDRLQPEIMKAYSEGRVK